MAASSALNIEHNYYTYAGTGTYGAAVSVPYRRTLAPEYVPEYVPEAIPEKVRETDVPLYRPHEGVLHNLPPLVCVSILIVAGLLGAFLYLMASLMEDQSELLRTPGNGISVAEAEAKNIDYGISYLVAELESDNEKLRAQFETAFNTLTVIRVATERLDMVMNPNTGVQSYKDKAVIPPQAREMDKSSGIIQEIIEAFR